jgi:creatinine amidohydrolase
MTARRAVDLDWFDFVERVKDGAPLFLGVGSFEQHGPHLPLGTDAMIATALTDGLAERCGGYALPTLSYGAPSRPLSGGGDLFPVPDVDLPTLLSTIRTVAGGCFAAGAPRLVAITWHFENVSVLWDAIRAAVQDNPGSQALTFGSPWTMIDDENLSKLTADGSTDIDWPADHAGLLETALMMAIAPDLCREPPAPVDFRPRPYEVLPTPKDAVPHTGVVNDARSVTAEAGQLCLDQMVEGIAAALEREPPPDR